MLDGLERKHGNPWVFTGIGEGAPVGDLTRYWLRLRKKMALADVRLHDLRHSFASRALGESLPMIGKLLGHVRVQTTARYAHLAERSVHESAARVAAGPGFGDGVHAHALVPGQRHAGEPAVPFPRTPPYYR